MESALHTPEPAGVSRAPVCPADYLHVSNPPYLPSGLESSVVQPVLDGSSADLEDLHAYGEAVEPLALEPTIFFAHDPIAPRNTIYSTQQVSYQAHFTLTEAITLLSIVGIFVYGLFCVAQKVVKIVRAAYKALCLAVPALVCHLFCLSYFARLLQTTLASQQTMTARVSASSMPSRISALSMPIAMPPRASALLTPTLFDVSSSVSSPSASSSFMSDASSNRILTTDPSQVYVCEDGLHIREDRVHVCEGEDRMLVFAMLPQHSDFDDNLDVVASSAADDKVSAHAPAGTCAHVSVAGPSEASDEQSTISNAICIATGQAHSEYDTQASENAAQLIACATTAVGNILANKSRNAPINSAINRSRNAPLPEKAPLVETVAPEVCKEG
ncbi:hypothetical protein BD626DRAFT_166525 [Schizophyllum amplum]|uniref:Uncharacterized protein n=1 Tax=Schizophyllum amplum TaxID=97359 RepID=A0A550CQ46_9AGAR|nr:hypothetical protein BD626DRAFT_166525 [Auriculariopsis ampla]